MVFPQGRVSRCGDFFINENIGTYVDGYITHRTIDGGDNWSNTVVKGEPTPFFNGLHFADADTGWAVGNRGDIFRTTDGGLAWTKMISPTAEHLQSVFFCDSKLGNAVGNHGTILRTADGGITWTQCESGTTLDLLNVWFADANTGIAVGTGGVILRTSDGGATWKNFLRAVTLQTLLSAHFHNAAIGTAIGKAGTILRTTDGGKSWLPQNSGTPHDLLGLAFIQSDTGFVVGKAGVILRTDDGGATWMKQTSGVSNNLNSVWLDRANVATAVGDSGVILRTLNGGASWEKQVSGTTNRLLCVSFSNLDTGIVVSTAGEIVHTNNGGRSWIKLSASPFPKIDAAYFADANNGILASSWIGSYGVPYAGIWTTANGGMTWKQWISISAFLPKTVSLSLYGEGVVVGDDGVISRKSAAETNWRTETRGTSNDLYGVAFIDSNHIVVVGEYGTIMQAKSNGVVSVREHGFLENVSPREPALLQNYPNPFNPSTTIEFFLPRASFVTLRIFDTLGQEVAVLISQFRSQGKQSVIWQTKELASGIYLCRLETKDRVQSRKLLLLR